LGVSQGEDKKKYTLNVEKKKIPGKLKGKDYVPWMLITIKISGLLPLNYGYKTNFVEKSLIL